ncbi:polysaccharide biosynthesis protein, partial [Bacteroides uniformis]|nr:polysaccharide biosynthesis protein [Bacteroides uniformis]
FDRSFYIPLYAKGQLKENTILTLLFAFLPFPIIYLLFKNGFSPVALSWSYLISYAIIGLVIKPYLLVKIVGYKWWEIIRTLIPCFSVTMVSVLLSYIVSILIKGNSASAYFLKISMMILMTLWVLYLMGLDKPLRNQIRLFLFSKIRK